MKIHCNALPYLALQRAAAEARVEIIDLKAVGSRSHLGGWTFLLEGESRRRPNGGSSDGFAATWDQWGVFLAALFDVDPTVKATYYADAGAFHAFTGHRFAEGWPDDAHGDHKWVGSGCRHCSAVQNWAFL